MIKRCAHVRESDGTITNVSMHCTIKSKGVMPKSGHVFVFHEKADVGDWWDFKAEELHKMCHGKKKQCGHEQACRDLPHSYMKYPAHKYQGE